MTQRVIFITGTDTGVGKTVLTALLLIHAQAGVKGTVAALKPFCSGGRDDAQLLCDLQEGQLTLDQVNPFHFPEPLSPSTAARLAGREITLHETLAAIRRVKADLLLIEGAGGLLAPLGEHFTALDLIKELRAQVIIAAANRLGVINHTSLTLDALPATSLPTVKIALISTPRVDLSSNHNLQDLREWTSKPLIPIPNLGDINVQSLRSSATGLEAELQQLLSNPCS